MGSIEANARTDAVDPAAVDQFAGKAFSDLGATFATLLCSYGDRHGLFRELRSGARSAADLAAKTGTNARYVEEWGKALVCAGYLGYEPASQRFTLPAAHAAVLADEGGPAFLGGFFQVLGAVVREYDGIGKAFAEGGGIDGKDFHPDLWIGEERSNRPWHDALATDWVPRLPAVEAGLQKGADVLDVGSGCGRAVVNLAKAFPKSRFTGLDILEVNVRRARDLAKAEGVTDRARFELQDIARGLPGSYDIATAFDVLHDVQDPPRLLQEVHRVLRPGGHFMVMEINVADDLLANVGPAGSLLYGISPFYCMTISLARGGTGFGTCGLPPGRFEALAKAAGFTGFERVDIGNPVQVLYDLAK